MDKLEQYIRDHKAYFNSRKMPKGHEKRFEKRLKGSQAKLVPIRMVYWAAAIAVFISLSIPWLLNRNIKNTEVELCSYSPEVCEMKMYYTSSLKKSQELIKAYRDEGIANDGELQMLQTELSELDKIHKQVAADLQVAPDDERVINALIDVYRKKQELVNTILYQLNEAKKQKNVKNEMVQL